MSETNFYQIIKEKYLGEGVDYVTLFRIVKSMADEIGLGQALELLGKREDELRKIWMKTNLAKFERSGDVFTDVLEIFYKGCFGLDIEKDGEIVEQSDRRLITRWRNPCPILVACDKCGLDTRDVCKKAFHQSNQTLLSLLDTRLKFARNYQTGIRPHASYCEEIIILED
jgi:hypothetical protein